MSRPHSYQITSAVCSGTAAQQERLENAYKMSAIRAKMITCDKNQAINSVSVLLVYLIFLNQGKRSLGLWRICVFCTLGGK